MQTSNRTTSFESWENLSLQILDTRGSRRQMKARQPLQSVLQEAPTRMVRSPHMLSYV